MLNEKLVDYISGGMERGFGKDHIKDVLLKHGYTPHDIRIATEMAVRRTQGQQKNNQTAFFIAGAAIVILVAAIVAFSSPAQKGITGYTISDQEYAAKLQKIIDIDKQALERNEEIMLLFQQLNDNTKTINEKEELIEKQQENLEDLHRLIMSERDEVRSSLLDLLNYIIAKAREQ